MTTDLHSRIPPAHGASALAPSLPPLAVGGPVARWPFWPLAGAGLWYFVLRGDAPPPASLDDALAGVSAPAPSSDPATNEAPATTQAPASTTVATTAPASPVEGTWTIDRTITNAQGTGSYTGFRVNEVLTGIGSTTAVGRTPNVEGTLTVQGTTLTAATINANLTAVTTNDSRRDDNVQRALATSRSRPPRSCSPSR